VGNEDRTFITRAEPMDITMKVMKDEWRKCKKREEESDTFDLVLVFLRLMVSFLGKSVVGSATDIIP